MRELGSGGFGDVVLARHDESGSLVAIKYLRRALLDDPGFTWLFREEARVLASLDDPNVVRLYEYVESPSGAAIVMELVDGVSLRDILSSQGKTSAEAALVVLLGSLLGLAAAHARGVVHRDYKPANVLVDRAGVSKLTDFGIAVRAGNQAPATGTLAYAPPEQFRGGLASPAGDVYAATATFYECLTGGPPFTGGTSEELLSRHLSEPVPLDPVPEALRPLVDAGMAKDPRKRPADAAVLLTLLRTAAVPAYGTDWEDRGRSHLGEAALLLAALWPSGTAPATQGQTVEQVHLSHGAQGHQDAQHLQHLRHVERAAHLKHEHAEHAEHVQHVEHVEHVRHEEHLEHLRHLEHERAEHSGDPDQSAPGGPDLSAAATEGVKPADATADAGTTPPPSPRVIPLPAASVPSSTRPSDSTTPLPHDMPGELPSLLSKPPSRRSAVIAGVVVAVLIGVLLIHKVTAASPSGSAAAALPASTAPASGGAPSLSPAPSSPPSPSPSPSPSPNSLAGSWTDANGNVFQVTATGSDSYSGQVVQDITACPHASLQVAGSDGHYTGTITFYTKPACDQFIGNGPITIDVAPDGTTAQVTAETPGSGPCTDCAPTTWTRNGSPG